jgi:hypothetical protein
VAAALAIAALSSVAAAEVKPERVDIAAFRDELIVLRDADGNTYVVKPPKRATKTTSSESARVWFGLPGKELHEQVMTGHSRNGAAWTANVWAPRIPQIRPGLISFKDGSYAKSCWTAQDTPLVELSPDKARAVLDRGRFLTPYLTRRPHVLGRDDAGVYYYVDRYREVHGGKGYRVFVGKKGAMKQLPLSDVASDSAGEVFSTRTGDLRLAHTTGSEGRTASWIRGGKRTELVTLDLDINSVVIFSELGVYKFLGTICDDI